MTITQLLQFYVPLAGLVLMAFWMGALSNRVKTLEKIVNDDEIGRGERGDRLTRLEEGVKNLRESQDRMARAMEGVQRQLGNLMQRGGKIVDLGHMGAE